MLTRLVYASQAATALTPEMIETILATARTKNRLRDLTGLLMFDHRHFLQVLEGDRQVLSKLLVELMRDPRHQQVELLSVEPIAERLFGDWTMGFAGATAFTRSLMLRHTTHSQFEPRHLSAHAALAVLLSASKELPIGG